MKASILLAQVLALLFTSPPLTKASNPVLDTDGHELQVGTPYFLLGATLSSGPVSISKTPGNIPCQQNIVKYRFANPIPVTFYLSNSSESLVRTKNDYNFVFDINSDCSNVWMIHPPDESSLVYSVTTGGQLGNPGCKTVDSWFQIEAVKGAPAYKLITNPQVCDDLPIPPMNIVVINNGKERRLGATYVQSDEMEEVIVRFQKSSSASIEVV